MRKFLALMAALMMCFVSAAALEKPYPADTVLTVLPLTETQQTLADMLYDAVFAHQARIELPPGTRYDDASAALQHLMLDYPELFHLGRNYTLGYYRDQPEYATWVEPQYRLSAAEAGELRALLYAQSYMLVQANPDPEALHDALCRMTSYGGTTEMIHTAPGALLQGQATCEGYAQALTLLYRMAGIPCGVITGDAVDSSGNAARHAWNIADIDGYTLIDATWNDQDVLGLNTHWYYGLSTGQMAVDHIPDAELSVPLCDAHANWHDRHGYIVSGLDNADKAIRRLVAGEVLNLRIDDHTLYAALAHDTFSWLGRYNERTPDAPFYGSYSVTVSDAQQCIILQRAD